MYHRALWETNYIDAAHPLVNYHAIFSSADPDIIHVTKDLGFKKNKFVADREAGRLLLIWFCSK